MILEIISLKYLDKQKFCNTLQINTLYFHEFFSPWKTFFIYMEKKFHIL